MKEAARLNGYELIDEQARAEIAKLKEGGGGKLYMHRYKIFSFLTGNGLEGKYFSTSNQPLTTLFSPDNPEDGTVDIAKLKNIIIQTIWERYEDGNYIDVVPVVNVIDDFIYRISGIGVEVGQTYPEYVMAQLEVSYVYGADFEITEVITEV